MLYIETKVNGCSV